MVSPYPSFLSRHGWTGKGEGLNVRPGEAWQMAAGTFAHSAVCPPWRSSFAATAGERRRGRSPARGEGVPSPGRRRHRGRAAKLASTQHFTSRAAGTRVGLRVARGKVRVRCAGSFTAPCGKGRDSDDARRAEQDPARSRRGWAGAARTETARFTPPGCGAHRPSARASTRARPALRRRASGKRAPPAALKYVCTSET